MDITTGLLVLRARSRALIFWMLLRLWAGLRLPVGGYICCPSMDCDAPTKALFVGLLTESP